MKRNRNSICALAFFAFSAGSYAVTKTWDGGGTNNNWSTAANWDLNAVPVDGADLVFTAGGLARKTNNNDIVGLDVRSLAINDSGYVIDGNAITLSNGITAHALVAGPSPSFGCDLTLLQALSFINTGTVRMVLSGALNLNGFNLTVDGSDEITLAGAISGNGGITMNGSGKLFINASNTYQGVTIISNGTVDTINSRALGATGAGNDTVVASGASLRLETGQVVPEAITLSGTGVASLGALTAIMNPITSCTITGAVTLADNSTVNVIVGKLNMNGPIGGGAFGLTKAGAGTLVLGNSNTYNGTTTVSNGNLLVNGNNAGSPINLAGGTLGGTGTVGAITATGGTVAPGNSPGTLTSNSNVTFNAATTFAVEIGGAIPGLQHDRLVVSNAPLGSPVLVDLGGANLTGTLTNGFNPANGTQFTILAAPAGAITGQFAQGSSVIISGRRFSITYFSQIVRLAALAQPVLTGVSLDPVAGGVVLSATNGDSATTFSVLASTNIFLPLTNWQVVAADFFDGSGNFTITNAVDPALPQQFLIIQYP